VPRFPRRSHAEFTHAALTAADIAGVVLHGFSIQPSMNGGLQAAIIVLALDKNSPSMPHGKSKG